MAVKILIDSASDISEKEAKELGIEMIPMEINFAGEEYLDGVNLLPIDFYEKLIENTELPKTSQINPFRFEEALEKMTEDGSEVVVITLSSKLSSTFKSATTAAEKFKDKVFVVDSMNACIGERLLCLHAIKLKSEGLGAKKIKDELDAVKGKINVMAMLDTLEYLKKGGRISLAVTLAGTLLSIKPVIGVVNGEVKLIGKAMGSKKANNLLKTLIKEKGGINFDMPFGVVWSGRDKSMLEKYVNDNEVLWSGFAGRVPSYMIGSTIGAHVGPGAIGVAFFEK